MSDKLNNRLFPFTEPGQRATEHYAHVRNVQNRKCGIQPFLTTVGVVIDINDEGYGYRYCFKEHSDAVAALSAWGGVDPLPGPWLKVKGSYRGRTLDHVRGNPHFEAMCAEWRLQGRKVRIKVQGLRRSDNHWVGVEPTDGETWARMEVARVEPSFEDPQLWAIAGKGGLIIMVSAAEFNNQVIIEG